MEEGDALIMNVAIFAMHRYKIKLSQFPARMVKKIRGGDVDRAGSTVRCEICGFEYFDHPTIENYDQFHVICSNTGVGVKVYKL